MKKNFGSLFFSLVFATVIYFFAVANALAQSDNPMVGIGQWRIHLPYNNISVLTEGNGKVYCAGRFGMFSYNKSDGSLERFTRISGLSDLEISTIRYNAANGVLVIAYLNSNIDLLFDDNTVVNLSDIQRKNIVGSKSINHILFGGRYAYLSCGFGIVQIDLSRREIKDTWYIGGNGSALTVNQLATDGIKFYAATASGIMTADASDPALFNFASWSLDTTIKNVLYSSTGNISSIVSFSGKIFAVQKGLGYGTDSVLVNDGTNWSLYIGSAMPFVKLETEFSHFIISSGWGVNVKDNSLLSISNADYTSYKDSTAAPVSGYLDPSGIFWIADAQYGLVKGVGASYSFIFPNGPYNIANYAMAADKNNLWAVSGAIDLQAPRYFNYGTYLYNNYSQWKNFNRTTDPVYESLSFTDVVCVAIDPDNSNHAFVGTWGSGLLEYGSNGVTEVYNDSNSTLQPITHPTFKPIYVGGVAYDDEKNLWVANPSNPTPLSVRLANGTWKSFSTPSTFAAATSYGLLIDDFHQKWITTHIAGLGVFNENDMSNPNDDSFKALDAQPGTGNLPSLNVFSLAKDKDGAIWIGSDKGVAVVYNPGNVFSGGSYDAQKILIEQDGHTQYLLETDYVLAIAVDGANRKWFGTLSGGVFLMSADGTKQIFHFDTDNSPLLNNTVTNIAINPGTGEVFFGTGSGICSYRSDATEGDSTCNDYYVFPNPVSHDYHGKIAIKGLVANASVKIADLSGQVVFQTKANGGEAIWDGNNFSGTRAHTGVYLVYVTNEDGSATCVTKMLFTN